MSATDTTTAPPHGASGQPPRRPSEQPTPRAKPKRAGAIATTTITWILGLLFFFPILWMVLLSFRFERDAAVFKLFATFTGSNYDGMFSGDLLVAMINSLWAGVVSTLLVIALALPAAYALSIRPVAKWTDTLFFFLSTKMMPVVAALLPIYLLTNEIGLNDNIWTLVIVYTSANLPIAVWMLRSFLLEVPVPVIEAAQVDGAKFGTIMTRVILPMITPGVAATGLICFIFSWNEFLFALRLTGQNAKTVPVYLAGSIAPEGLFLAHLCAVAVVVSIPVLVAGWAAQDKLVRGLSLGAVK